MSDTPRPKIIPQRTFSQVWHTIVVSLAQAIYHEWRPITATRASYNTPRPDPGVVAATGEVEISVEHYARTGERTVILGIETTVTRTQFHRAHACLKPDDQARIDDYLSQWPVTRGDGKRPRTTDGYPDMNQGHYMAWMRLARQLGMNVTPLHDVPTPEFQQRLGDLIDAATEASATALPETPRKRLRALVKS